MSTTEEQREEILHRAEALGPEKRGLATDEESRPIHAEVVGD